MLMRRLLCSGADRGATAALLDDVRRALNESSGEEDGEEETMLVSTLASTDCSNLTSALRALIGGFIATHPDFLNEEEDSEVLGGRASARPLAPYDINLLKTWFDKMCKLKGEKNLPKLVVLVSDLEKVDPAIMQDVFYICSLHIPHLPLVFVLGLSTPPTPSYLHAVYPRTTLALLRLTRVEVHGGPEVLEKVLLDTFFDPTFAPNISLSPATLAFVVEQFARIAQSIDVVLSLLQLIFLRHYVDPLAVLVADELLGEKSVEEAVEKLSEPGARPFLISLLARLHHPEKGRANEDEEAFTEDSPHRSKSKTNGKGKEKEKEKEEVHWVVRTPLEALERVRAVRETHMRRARGARVAFRVVLEVRRHLLESGVALKGGGGEAGKPVGVCEMMGACLRGTLAGREGKVFATAIRKLPRARLLALISDLRAFVTALSATVRDVESDMVLRLADWDAHLNSPEEDYDTSEVAIEVGDWLLDYTSERMRDYTETNLWDLWYTGNPQGILEVFNPAPRAAVVSALVHPERYLDDGNDSGEGASAVSKATRRAVAGTDAYAGAARLVPDTSILFQRYLDSGRMVNVYDWYSAFAGALDAQRVARRREAREGVGRRVEASGTAAVAEPADLRRRHDHRGSRNKDASPSVSPTKSRGKQRGRGGASRGRARGRGGRGGDNSGPTKGRPGVSGSDEDEGKYEEGDEIDESPEEKERWQEEVQARFIRSVHELDFLGFVKHTGRKIDHVHKTVYDLPEY